jgi:ferritin-like metal-binding protein YciE
MALESMRELLALELQDIYGAEEQVLKALPSMAKAATALGLKQAFERHLVETRGQLVRLEQSFAALGPPASGKHCKGM